MLIFIDIAAAESAGVATINADSLAVHSGMSARSAVVKALKKGDQVTVSFEMEGPEGAWCGILEKGQKDISGYVPCRHLDREVSRQQWRSVGSQTEPLPSKSSRGKTTSPSAEKNKRPFSDITAVMYMTTW
jgi:cystathionine beta-lyase/cystathionine gamma-synthase